MQPHTIILLEGGLSLGLPLALAARELWLLRRDPPRDGRDPRPLTPPPAPLPQLRTRVPQPRREPHPEWERELQPEQVLEDA